MAYQGVDPYFFRGTFTNIQVLDTPLPHHPGPGSGFNGVQTQFKLQLNGSDITRVTANGLLITLGGVTQRPGIDYTISSGILTFTTAPISGLNIEVRKFQGLNGEIDDAQLTLFGLSDTTISSPSTGQVLKYTGSNWVNGSYDIVNDTSPQLGGTLDINGQTISAGTNTFDITSTNSIAVKITRADTRGPTLSLRNGESTTNYETYINCWGSLGGGTNRTNMFEINGIVMDGFQYIVKDTGTFYWSFGNPSSGRELELTSSALYPSTDNGLNLGSSTNRWNNIYTGDIQLSNEGSQNEVDGTWGTWTIQEGENDLFLLNRRNGKKYKFSLEEVI